MDEYSRDLPMCCWLLKSGVAAMAEQYEQEEILRRRAQVIVTKVFSKRIWKGWAKRRVTWRLKT